MAETSTTNEVDQKTATERTKESSSDLEAAASSEKSDNKETTEEEKAGEEETPEKGLCQRIGARICTFYNNNDFICQVVIAILLARAYPPLGAEYLQPQITSTWIAVIFIFSK